MAEVAAESLWNAMATTVGEEFPVESTNGSGVSAVVRWAVDVAEYRESCRYIQTLLPPRTSVVVDRESGQMKVAPPAATSRKDDYLAEYIRGCWTLASALLARATHMALQFYPELPRGLEQICRHVDYVITGRLKKKHDPSGATLHSDETLDPPPTELFDHLLKEMQLLVVRLPESVVDDGVRNVLDEE